MVHLALGQIILRLLLAALLGGLLGLERELKHKAAGLRTSILVCLGSTLIMIVSLQFLATPSHLASGVVASIGFFGAGLIIKGHDKDEIFGITTAVTIWIVSAIGLAVGVGYYSAAICTTIIALIILYFLGSDKLRKMAGLNH